ncbi:MAG: STAS domain-containing protein [Myxococcota bacterium]
MQCKFDPRGGKSTGVIELSGRLDLLTAAELKDQIQRLVADGWSQLVVDLESVLFVDSSGLGALINGLKAARHAGGDFRIARPPEQVRYILQVSTLDQVLKPYPTVEDALAEYV